MKRAAAIVIVLALVSALGILASGCQQKPGATVNTQKNATALRDAKQQTSAEKNPQPSVQAVPTTVPEKTISVTLYFGDEQAEKLVPEVRQIKETASLLKDVVTELVRGPQAKDHTRTIPPEAKVLNVDVINGTAYVNFSLELISKHWGGSTGEIMTVDSLVDTLTEFKNVKKVQILVEGKAVDTITGHLDTSKPFTRDESIIKK